MLMKMDSDFEEDKNYDYGHIILPFKGTSHVPFDVPSDSEGSLSQRSINSSVMSKVTRDTQRSKVKSHYHGAEAWWVANEHFQQGRSYERKHGEEWMDLSDSVTDLYREINQRDRDSMSDSNSINLQELENNNKTNVDKMWLLQDTSNGFVRVFEPESENSRLFPCTLSTMAQKLCFQCGRPPNSLHIQLNGDIIRRLEPFDCPLALQNEFLQHIGYSDIRKVQEMGSEENLPYLVKFFAGKPVSDSTYSRNQLKTYCMVRKGKLLHQWVQRICVVSGTRLLIYRDSGKKSKPTVVHLAKGYVEEAQVKGYDYCLKLTSTLQGDRSVYLAFTDKRTFDKWHRKTKKATAKLPTKADLSNCHLEFLPETVFVNDDLRVLNLRHNALKERPIEEDIYTIGWLDDLPRFSHLQSLNLADNNLQFLPASLCNLKVLTELNIASNKLTDLPHQICDLVNLQVLHAHNNHLSSLPDTMTQMRNLKVVVLAFNHFTSIPHVFLFSEDSLLRLESIIMAGNRVEKIPADHLNRMQHVKKIDLRMNSLSLLPSETSKYYLLENVTHLDVRDNKIADLDVRSLKCLEYLNCERCGIRSLQINGSRLKNLFAANNDITTLSVNPKPEWLVIIDVSYNKLESLPSWLPNCFFMIKLCASHNRLTSLPEKLFASAIKLKILLVNHNLLSALPLDFEKNTIEDLQLQHNFLKSLPERLFLKSNKLRTLNVTSNQISSLPIIQYQCEMFVKLTEMFLSNNRLGDDVFSFVSHFSRLKVLHLAHNMITEMHSRDVIKMESLQELNISGNMLRSLPSALPRHEKLQILRANSNLLKDVPDFKSTPNLKVLDIGSNRLSNVPITKLMASKVHLLDISGNPEIFVDGGDLRGLSHWKKISMVDMRGQNRSLLDLRQSKLDDDSLQWQSGLSQTSGMRNKLSVGILNQPSFTSNHEGLFGLFDGGKSDEVIKILSDVLADSLKEELTGSDSQDYMKYGMLKAHMKLKEKGQSIGASAALCHLVRSPESTDGIVLNVSNVGDTEVILSRCGEAIRMSRLFLVHKDAEECARICKNDGIITEDGRISGNTFCSRLLGCSFLYPHVLPNPHVTSINLRPDDQMIIIANQGLWNYISYQEAVNEIINIPDPVAAAKRLQDLAQGYGSRESIGILVVKLFISNQERNRMKKVIQDQFELEQKVLQELKQRDNNRLEEKRRRRAELRAEEEGLNMEILKLKKEGKHRAQAAEVFGIPEECGGEYVSLKTMSDSDQGSVDSSNWQKVLENRLASKERNKELEHFFETEGMDLDQALTRETDDPDTNWATKQNIGNKKKTYLGDNPEVIGRFIANGNHGHYPMIEPSISQESMEFVKEYKMPFNVDRDAVLFHEMQMTRAKGHSTSCDSLDSAQSLPVSGSIKQMGHMKKLSSHSIEVLMNTTSSLPRNPGFGGSMPEKTDSPDITQGKQKHSRKSSHDKASTDPGDATKSPIMDRHAISDGKILKRSKVKSNHTRTVIEEDDNDDDDGSHLKLRQTKSDADKESCIENETLVNQFASVAGQFQADEDKTFTNKNFSVDQWPEEFEEQNIPCPEPHMVESIYANHPPPDAMSVGLVSVDPSSSDNYITVEAKLTPPPDEYSSKLVPGASFPIQSDRDGSDSCERTTEVPSTEERGPKIVNIEQTQHGPKRSVANPKRNILISAKRQNDIQIHTQGNDTHSDARHKIPSYLPGNTELYDIYTDMPNGNSLKRSGKIVPGNKKGHRVMGMAPSGLVEEDTSIVSAYKDKRSITGFKPMTPPLGNTGPLEESENQVDSHHGRKTKRAPSPPVVSIATAQNLKQAGKTYNGSPSPKKKNGHHINLAIEDVFAQMDIGTRTNEEQAPSNGQTASSLSSLKVMYNTLEKQAKANDASVGSEPKQKVKERAPVPEGKVSKIQVQKPPTSIEHFLGQSLAEQNVIVTYL